MAVLAIVALCRAMTSSAAAADDGTADGRQGPAAEPTTPRQGRNLYPLKSVPLNGKTFEEFVAEGNGSMTSEEAAAAVAESERNSSSTVHFYPDAPDDPRVDPPALDDNGDD
ncbi:hypothetical protein [Paractinoplanes ferrugineus]|uniref:hypothetical protein n=1 Tax=Paractinoplanes ferrugineus TaxID=113564 RepID=UPI00194132DB|nr:hypothetical protein [Actinoplanes ferrugineus]